jgi:hypothetical protein
VLPAGATLAATQGLRGFDRIRSSRDNLALVRSMLRWLGDSNRLSGRVTVSTTTLTEYLRAQAAWRAREAEQHPSDGRHLQSAAALRSLADFVESGDAEEVVSALEPHLTGAELGGQRTSRAVTRYGYGYEVSLPEHEKLLGELVQLCLQDAYERTGERGEDDTGTLRSFEVQAARDGIPLGPGYFRLRSRALERELVRWVRESRG